MNVTVLAIGILALAGIVVVGFFVLSASRSKRAVENVPVGMRPGYSDEQLERTVLERYMAWGLVLTVFFAVFFPVYWVRETNRLTQATEQRFITQVVTGESLYVTNCAECHGTTGAGGGAPSPYDAESIWPAPNLRDIVVRYEDNPNIIDIEDFIEQTLHRGRPGTPMPAWGESAGGPLTDEDIRDITLWILANQDDEELAEPASATDVSGEELYQQNCMKCHGPDLEGLDAGEGRPGPSLIGVFDRHSEESILGILRNGVKVPTGTIMPPWQEGYMYPESRYDDDALNSIIDYLREQTPPTEDADADADEEGDVDGDDDDIEQVAAPASSSGT